MSKKMLILFSLVMVGILLLTACGPAPNPVTIVETVPVEVIKEVEVPGEEVTVVETVVVTAAPEAKPFEGVELNILTFTDPQIAEPLQRRGPDFEALTGAKVNVVIVPFADLYSQILTDAATGTNSYDAWVFAPQWMVDYITPHVVKVHIHDLLAPSADPPRQSTTTLSFPRCCVVAVPAVAGDVHSNTSTTTISSHSSFITKLVDKTPCFDSPTIHRRGSRCGSDLSQWQS